MALEFRSEYTTRLPWPLAQLYSRAYNDKSPRSRHNYTFYLFEAFIKLTAAVLASAYVDDGPPAASQRLDELMSALERPSLGDWLALMRELARHYHAHPELGRPLGHLWTQLDAPRRDAPAMLELYRRIKNGVDGQPALDQSCSLLNLLDALVGYRNVVFGHGAEREESFYDREMGPLLFPAANELLADGAIHPLGPPGTRLLFVDELKMRDRERAMLEVRDLSGFVGVRSEIVLDRLRTAALEPRMLGLLWPGAASLLRLDPLLHFSDAQPAAEVLFLNGRKKRVEYLSYTTGRTERVEANSPESAALDGLLSRFARGPAAAATPDDSALDRPGPTGEPNALAADASGSASAGALRGGPLAGVVDLQLVAEVGHGQRCGVYIARQLSLGRIVAVKVLSLEAASNPAILRRWDREINALARCEHPNIIKVLLRGTQADGRGYYAMEFVPGCTLEALLDELGRSTAVAREASSLSARTLQSAALAASVAARKRLSTHAAPGPAGPPTPALPPLPEELTEDPSPGGYARRVVEIIQDAASALAAVHEQNIIHRDIHPGNLMLTADGARIVLMDFGLARDAGSATVTSGPGSPPACPRYAAPEAALDSSFATQASDVRALGAVAWELLARQRLFADAQSDADVLRSVQIRPVPRLRSIDPSIDKDLDAIIALATAHKPGERLPTARHLACCLENWLDGKSPAIPLELLPSAAAIDAARPEPRPGAGVLAAAEHEADAGPPPWAVGASAPAGTRPRGGPRTGPRTSRTSFQRRQSALKFQVGQAIHDGRFTILAFEGGGGMGEVYRARDNQTGEEVALKFLPRERTNDPASLEQLKSEVRTAHRVHSHNTCAVHDIFVPQPTATGVPASPPFISMEYIEGEDLERLLHRVESLSPAKVSRIAYELGQGLRAIHHAGLLHRDLKPSNVMLDLNGEARILDFGIAAPAAVESGFAGTVAYMAPEVRDGAAATPASDLYALGLILLELLTGRRPEAQPRFASDTATMFGKSRDQVPPALRAAVERCLARSPADRFQSVEEFLAALPAESTRSVRRAETIHAIAASEAATPLTAWSLGAALAMIAAAVAAFVLLPPRHGVIAQARTPAIVPALIERSRDIADRLQNVWPAPAGPRETPSDAGRGDKSAWGFGPDRELIGPRASKSAIFPSPNQRLRFWYRQSNAVLEPLDNNMGVSQVDPPTSAGAGLVLFDGAGGFVQASRAPTAGELASVAGETNLLMGAPALADSALREAADLLRLARGPELAPTALVLTEPEPRLEAIWPDAPPTPVWRARARGSDDPARRYLLSAVGPHLVYLQREPPPAAAPPGAAGATSHATAAAAREALSALNFWWTALATILGLLLARRNMRLGRCDVRSATRIATIVFAAMLAGWALLTHPTIVGPRALSCWTAGVGAALFTAAQAWVFYAAVDPYARLTWKRVLIGYARLTTDWPRSLRDPLVGRSLLCGLAFGIASVALLNACDHFDSSPGADFGALVRETPSLRAWGSNVRSAGLLLNAVSVALRYSLQQLVIIVLMFWLTRSRGPALALFCVANTALMVVYRNDYSLIAAATMGVFSVLTAFTVVREGILASAVGMFTLVVLLHVPLTLDPRNWNFALTLGVLAILGSIGAIGVAAALRAVSFDRLRRLVHDPIEQSDAPLQDSAF